MTFQTGVYVPGSGWDKRQFICTVGGQINAHAKGQFSDTSNSAKQRCIIVDDDGAKKELKTALCTRETFVYYVPAQTRIEEEGTDHLWGIGQELSHRVVTPGELAAQNTKLGKLYINADTHGAGGECFNVTQRKKPTLPFAAACAAATGVAAAAIGGLLDCEPSSVAKAALAAASVGFIGGYMQQDTEPESSDKLVSCTALAKRMVKQGVVAKDIRLTGSNTADRSEPGDITDEDSRERARTYPQSVTSHAESLQQALADLGHQVTVFGYQGKTGWSPLECPEEENSVHLVRRSIPPLLQGGFDEKRIRQSRVRVPFGIPV